MEESGVTKAVESKIAKSKVKPMLIGCFDVRGIVHTVLATVSDDQLTCLQRNHAAFSWFSANEEARIAAGQVLAASPRQRAGSQHPEHLAVSC